MSDSSTHLIPLLLAALASLVGCKSDPYGLPPRDPYLGVPIVQGLIGVVEFDDDDLDLDSSLDAQVEDDSRTLPLLGGAVQYPVVGGPGFQFGFEGGGTIAWDSDTVRVATNGGTVIVRADNDLFLVDAFVGGYANLYMGRRFRIWAGAGPLLQWGSVDMDYDDAGVPVDISDTGFGGGGYARAGLEFEFVPNTWAGLSVRYVNSSLDFGEGVENIDFEATQIVLVVSVRY